MNCKFHNVLGCEFLCLNMMYQFEQSSSGKVEFTPLNSHELPHFQKYCIILLSIELLFVPLRIFHSHWRYHFWLNKLIGAILTTYGFQRWGLFYVPTYCDTVPPYLRSHSNYLDSHFYMPRLLHAEVSLTINITWVWWCISKWDSNSRPTDHGERPWLAKMPPPCIFL
jgi:hypothetical protein